MTKYRAMEVKARLFARMDTNRNRAKSSESYKLMYVKEQSFLSKCVAVICRCEVL
jgi:hypothetical protein